MYSINSYNGADLPEKTLCLTYDDGPGEHTEAIGHFLYNEGIAATFFVVGKYALSRTDILAKLKKWGHLIGNHTYDHPEMPYYVSINGDIHSEILRTDAIIKPYIDSDTTYFRSPYGTWSKEVAQRLNESLHCSLNHLGPIRWDIDGIDCYFWQTGRSLQDALDTYLNNIREKKRGIMVMHDEIADMDYVKPMNQTLELTKRLITILKEEGYRFVRLDQIESIAKESLKPLKANLALNKGNNITLSTDEQASILTNGQMGALLSELIISDAGNSKIAIKAANGLYLNLKGNEDGTIAAKNQFASGNALFDLIPVSENLMIIRASNGNYLTRGIGARLLANAKYFRNATVFQFLPVNLPINRRASFKIRLSFLRNKLRYIKSKLFPAE